MSITGDPDARGRPSDQGRRRDQRRRDRPVRHDRRPGRAARQRRRAARHPGPRPADRRLAARLDPGHPREPGAERVRRRPTPRRASATPIPTSCRTRRSRRATASWRWRSARTGSGRGSARRSTWRTWRPTRASPRTAIASSDHAELRPILADSLRDRDRGRLVGSPRGRRHPVRPDPRHPGGLRVPGGRRTGDDGDAGPPALGAITPGRDPVRARHDAGAPSGRRRRSSASTPTRSWTSSASAPRRSPPLRADGVSAVTGLVIRPSPVEGERRYREGRVRPYGRDQPDHTDRTAEPNDPADPAGDKESLVSINVRAHGLPSFPTIRIVDISPFHLPIRSARPTTAVDPPRRRDQRPRPARLLLFGAVAAARGAANGF